jgi:hypothetical protein
MYTLHEKTLINIKLVMENYIKIEKVSVTRQSHHISRGWNLHNATGLLLEHQKGPPKGTFMIAKHSSSS